MLNPVDTDAVIRDGGARGRFPDEIHPAVAWWLAACYVVTARADRLVIAHDGRPETAEFFDRLGSGAINAQHYRCLVLNLGDADEETLITAMAKADRAPGMRATTENGRAVITCYDRDGKPLTDRTGLLVIRSMIAEDRVPLPVNDACKGRIETYEETQA
ncbi:hypothetical protein [Streptomyces sp. NPDC048606]|uniref:hypothetical protein n=1 Tax=Streptomyces sp. NPDC048606 TaxID=3154726 RepID=UPI0034162335